MSKAWRIISIWIGAVFLLIGMCSGGVALAYHNRFYPGVKVGSLSLGGMSRADGTRAIFSMLTAYEREPVVIKIPDLTKPLDPLTARPPLMQVQTTTQELGIRFSPNTLASQAWSTGHGHHWAQGIFNERPVAITFTIDPKSINQYVQTQLVSKINSPTPAKLIVTDGVISVSPSASGLILDQKAFANQLRSALANITDGDTIFLAAAVTSADSPITTETVQPLASQLDALGNLPIALTASGVRLNPTRAQKLAWFTPVQDDSGNLSLVLNQTAISQYLAQTTSVEPTKSTQAVLTALGPLTTTAIPSSLAVALTLNNQPKPVTGGTYTPGRVDGKYIEVDLKAQRLFRITGSTLEKTYIISSGKASTPTPTGQFTVNGHAKMAFSHLYGLYMPFWMNFKDNLYGLHELPVWPDGYREGANHLGIPVSDGCIRLGIGDAEELYDWTPNGTPLFVH